ncbi:alanine--tRNA ligase [Candidatus Collierbacteria bacterium]|nr:alanine--tRNA ligase [Candidatus Collierbacteria bacterium]
MITGSVIRQKYLNFFSQRGHKIIPSAPLIPENDPTTLFTGSGMQPMMPYLLGSPHPLGRRLADSQKCFRAGDVEEVGDNRHQTFFEMLGNWSLGDYFKSEQLSWFWQFLTQEIGLDPQKIYVSVFIGDKKNGVPKDEEAISIWQKLFTQSGIEAKQVDLDTEENASLKGMRGGRIFAYGVKKNWWARNGAVPATMSPGEPGGPDSEVFYDFATPHDPKFGKECHPNCDCGRFLEIGNSVFMQYQKQKDGSLKELSQKNIDFGGGLERILAAKLNSPDVFQTDLLLPLIKHIENLTGKAYVSHPAPMRIIADHLKAAIFMLAEGIEPSNKQQGYILRRLLRRAAVKIYQLNPSLSLNLSDLVDSVIKIYPGFSNLELRHSKIISAIDTEITKFQKTLAKGTKVIASADPKKVDSKFVFNLYQSYGFPMELSQELLGAKGIKIDDQQLKKEFEKHQQQSRSTSKGMFKGGLADHSQVTTRYHTATHLLHQSLRKVLGSHVQQAGSNITAERARFDFTHPKALTPDELSQIEVLINRQIDAALPVTSQIMTYPDAINSGALAFFKSKYPQMVTVYSIGDFSRELCGGPHVGNTKEIGKIKIGKQEALGSSLRRLYFTLT